MYAIFKYEEEFLTCYSFLQFRKFFSNYLELRTMRACIYEQCQGADATSDTISDVLNVRVNYIWFTLPRTQWIHVAVRVIDKLIKASNPMTK